MGKANRLSAANSRDITNGHWKPFREEPGLALSMKAGHLAFETQALVGLRLFRMATGTVASARRNATMIPEKAAALADTRALVAERRVSDRTATKVGALYRGRVKAKPSKSPRISRH